MGSGFLTVMGKDFCPKKRGIQESVQISQYVIYLM